MSKANFIIIAVIVVVIVACGILGMKVCPTPESFVLKQTESQKILDLKDKLLLESAKTLDRMDKRLERMEQDLRVIRETLIGG